MWKPRKFSIAGENNPYWIMAEPTLLKIWADGILHARYFNLHLANIGSLIVNIIFFVGDMALRSGALVVALVLGYLAFPQTALISFEKVLDTASVPSSIGNLWLYRLLGYVILIEAVVFVLKELTGFLRDFSIYFC